MTLPCTMEDQRLIVIVCGSLRVPVGSSCVVDALAVHAGLV